MEKGDQNLLPRILFADIQIHAEILGGDRQSIEIVQLEVFHAKLVIQRIDFGG